MNTTQVTILEAESGHWLTNGQVFAKVVQLAPTDSPTNWREVTDEQKQAEEE